MSIILTRKEKYGKFSLAKNGTTVDEAITIVLILFNKIPILRHKFRETEMSSLDLLTQIGYVQLLT